MCGSGQTAGGEDRRFRCGFQQLLAQFAGLCQRLADCRCEFEARVAGFGAEVVEAHVVLVGLQPTPGMNFAAATTADQHAERGK